jgi:hypothetical protein
MKINPCVSSGIPWLSPEGDRVDVVPMQVFRSVSGLTIVRVGRNTLWFDERGNFDGTEHKMAGVPVDGPVAEQLIALLAESKTNQGQAPAEAYFAEGSEGWKKETAAWPGGPKPPDDEDLH